MTEVLLQVQGLSKNFGSLVGLAEVSFSLDRGEVLGVVGQHGSGKTVLVQLLSGFFPPSRGEIYFDGKKRLFTSAHSAHHLGIEVIGEQPAIVNNLNVVRNIFLGREIHWPFPGSPLCNYKLMVARVKELLEKFQVPSSILEERIVNLSDEQKHVIALARALSSPCRLLLLDNTLANLSYERQQILLEVIKELAVKDVAVIISSDDLKNLFAVTDRILVLYKSRPVAIRQTSESTPREIVELMVGPNQQKHITPVIWALENYHAIQKQADDLFQSRKMLEENLATQDSLNRQLLDRLHDQVKASEQLTVALRAANMRLMGEREQERKLIAREIHDQAIQDLLSFNYRLEQKENTETNPEQRGEISYIRSGIRRVVDELRQLCNDLRPPTIDSHGLYSAISSLAQDWTERQQVEIELDIDKKLGRLPDDIELSIFRIVQEGLINISKHASAKRVQLTLKRASTTNILIRLSDDGVGLENPVDFEELSNNKHFGLLGISERVALLSGSIKIKSRPGKGLTLAIEIPSPYP